jgi:putative transposase
MERHSLGDTGVTAMGLVRNVYRSLLLLVGATQKELARYVRYLQVENRILRSKLPKKVVVTPQERHRLARFAKSLKGALDELASIVHPDTIRRWIREERKRRPKRPGQSRRTAAEIERLIVRLAKETGWGYCRLLGELKKLGIPSVSATTVKNVLRRHGFDPGPRRGVGTWDEFLKIHAATLWQTDFISKRSLTRKGFRDLFVLVFLHVQTRRVYLSPATAHPDAAWVEEQGRAFLRFTRKHRLPAGLVMHDRDTKFTAAFDTVLQDGRAEVLKTPFRSPNLKDHASSCTSFLRWDGTLGKRRRSSSLWPCCLVGLSAVGGSNRHSCLSL